MGGAHLGLEYVVHYESTVFDDLERYVGVSERIKSTETFPHGDEGHEARCHWQ